MGLYTCMMHIFYSYYILVENMNYFNVPIFETNYSILIRSISILQPNVSAKVVYEFREDARSIQQFTFILEGDQYKQWYDDRYIMDLICAKHGVTRQPILPSPTINQTVLIQNSDGTYTSSVQTIPNPDYDPNVTTESYLQYPSSNVSGS